MLGLSNHAEDLVASRDCLAGEVESHFAMATNDEDRKGCAGHGEERGFCAVEYVSLSATLQADRCSKYERQPSLYDLKAGERA